MKKLIPVVFLVIAGILAYLFLFRNDKKEAGPEQAPLTISKNSDAFTGSFNQVLNSYYSLKDALVASDTIKANAAARQLINTAENLKFEEISGDSTGLIKETAKSFASTINGSSLGLLGEKGIEAKRKEFEMITEAMWSLSRTVRYDGGKIYYQYCPMAFDDKGAYWLSNEREIRNPYFGDRMLKCGSVEDSLNYSN